MDAFTGTTKDTFNLLIQLIAISDDDHTGIVVVGQDPAGQQHHHNALAAALGVPDNPAVAVLNMLLGSLDAEVLMDPWQFLDAAIKQNKVAQ